jgi:hypothetical protein
MTGCASSEFKCLPCLPADLVNPLVQMVCQTLMGLETLGKPCSAADIAQGRFVQAAFPQNATYCAAGPALIASGLATSLTCCNDKDLCNAFPVIVKTTQPLTSTLRCYQGVNSNIQLQTVSSPRCARTNRCHCWDSVLMIAARD